MHHAITLERDMVCRLSDLIRLNIDSYKEFQTAADAVEDPQLAALFQNFAWQRRAFADQLKQYVDEPASPPAERCSRPRARLHRWWLDLRARLSGNEQQAVLAEAERGEDQVRRIYEDVLRDPSVSAPVHEVLDQQYTAVKVGQDRIRGLREAGF